MNIPTIGSITPIPLIPLTDMFGEVLRWNVMFGTKIPGVEYNQMIALIKEEYEEFKSAQTDLERADALADIVVVVLGACARLMHRPVISGTVWNLVRNNWKSVTISDADVSTLYDEISRGYLDKAPGDFLELLFIYCRAQEIDIVGKFRQVMAANWTKYWTEEETKNHLPLGCKVIRVGGLVVKNSSGKIQKPPSFKHPYL